MLKTCHCTRMLAVIEATLDRIPAAQHDPTRLGTPVAEVVRGMLNKEYAQVQARHERHTHEAKPVYI